MVLSDSSPLITLAKIGRLGLLPQLYETVTITPEVSAEVVVSGAGLAGSSQISTAKWIHVKPVQKPANLARGEGLAVLGWVGVLHDAFGLKLVSDLPGAYRQLLASGAYVDRALLENILKILNLPPL